MDQATHVAIFGGSELLLVQLYRTYTSIVFPLGVIVRVTLPKGLLITCSCVEVCNFMPSAGVTVYVTSSLIRGEFE